MKFSSMNFNYPLLCFHSLAPVWGASHRTSFHVITEPSLLRVVQGQELTME